MAKSQENLKKSLCCRVSLLDDSEIEVTLDKKAHGEDLFDSVCRYLRLNNKDYFGILHTATETKGVWVKLNKKLKKQFKSSSTEWKFAIRVRYYPTDPSSLMDEITKYQLCLQTRLDLTSGILPCPLDILADMSSYWLQSEFGDFEKDATEVNGYLSSLRHDGTTEEKPDFEKRVMELYTKKRGVTPDKADAKFLNLASSLPLYGIHLFNGKDKAGKEVSIGIGAHGLYEKRSNIETMVHTWRRVKNIVYTKHKFCLKLLRAPPHGDPRLKKVFIFPSEEQTKVMWQCGVDHHVFFRIDGSGNEITGPIVKPSPKVKRKRTNSFKRLFGKKAKGKDVSIKNKPTVVREPSFRRSASFRETSASTSATVTPVTEKNNNETVASNTSQGDKINPELETVVEESGPTEANETEAEVIADDNEGEDGDEFKDEDFMEDVLDAVDGAMQESSNLLLTETINEEEEYGFTDYTKQNNDIDENDDSTEVKSPLMETSFDETVETKITIVEEIESALNESHTNSFNKTDVEEQDDVFPEIPTQLDILTEEINPERIESFEDEIFADEFVVTPEFLAEDNDSETETLTPEEEQPRKRSEVRFQDEIEIRVTSHSDEDNESIHSENIELLTTDMRDADDENGETNIYKLGETPQNQEKDDFHILDDYQYCDKTEDFEEKNDHSYNSIGEDKEDEVEEKVATWKGQLYVNKSTDEDCKTEGLSTTGAILGDDEFLFDELEEDSRYMDDIQEPNSKVLSDFPELNLEPEEKSSDSLSDITDNTDELCSNTIIEATWLRTLSPNDDIFLELFRKKPCNVKFRRDHHRKRKEIRSQIFDADLEEEVMLEEDALTPRITQSHNLNREYIDTKPLAEKEGSSRRRFIPSWPFDPQAYISRVTFDDLDKEALKAAMEAQQELMNENKRIEEMDFWNNKEENQMEEEIALPPIYDDVMKDVEFTKPDPSPTGQEISPCSVVSKTSPRMIGEQFIPGVPDFAHSVIHNYLHSSTSSSEITTSKNEVNVTEEELKYPSPIRVFSFESSEQILYDPPPPDQHANDVFSDDSTCKTYEEQSTATDISTPTSSKSFSSTSSFPSFIHSIFPLRKPSSSSDDRKRGRSKQRKVRNQRKSNKVTKKKSRSLQKKDKSPIKTKQGTNHKIPKIEVPDDEPVEEMENIVLSENDEVHFPGSETPDTVRKVN